MFRGSIPTEQLLVRTKENSLRRRKCLPNVCELTIVLGDLIQDGDVMFHSVCVRLHVAEGSIATQPNLAGLVKRNRPNRIASSGNLAPDHPVIFNEVASRDANVHDAAGVLIDGPYLAK